MTDWLLDTLIWTAALIAVVLIIRRPVARWIGPQLAYALWVLPAARLLLPPITLPAWLAPKAPGPLGQTDTILTRLSETPVATHEGATGQIPGSGTAATDLATPITPLSFLEALPWIEIGCAVWLIGAAIFMWHRFGSYFELRDQLLEGAREVGRSGRIRFVETEGTQAPLAFGVLDPVIAVPQGFMAQPDRRARDFALAHELAHHSGGDLLINVAVQPLFALHWFNPLGRYGWLALRRDQEAACDARVVSQKPAEERAAYATLIASFAAGPNVALAAPMACPVLGDKSIIHRLRSLNMSNPTSSRRWAGRAMIGAALLALPLTASISYAESQAPQPPAPPAAPAVGVIPPAPPAPPVPPVPMAAQAITQVDPDTGTEVEFEERREVDGQRNVFVIKEVDETDDGKAKTHIKRVKIKNTGEKMSKEEMDAIMAEVRSELDEADVEVKSAMQEVRKALIEIETSEGTEGRTVVKMECRGNSDDVATIEQGEGDHRKVYLCESKVMAHALKGLKEARNAIANDSEMDGEMRDNVLKEIDRQIKRWKTDSNAASGEG